MDEYFEQVLTSPWADGMGSIAVDAIGSLQSFQRMMPSGLDSIGGTENQQLYSEAQQDAMFDISKKSLNSNGRDRAPFRQSPQSISLIGSSWQEPTASNARPLPVSHGTFGILPLETGISDDIHLGKRIRGDNNVSMSNGEQPQGNEEQAQSVVTNGAGKPRVRARRGQATDPHSIAERNRRERIAERMKALQELVPDSNKTDKASMLDEIINYVKFLQMQVKCLSMCRLGGNGVSAPLSADLPAEGLGTANFIAANLAQANGVAITSQDGIAFAERQVARLMDEDMSAAMQYLQTKGLCLMPISLATAISSTGTTQQVTSSKTALTRNENGGEKEDMELQVFAARNGAALGSTNQVVHNMYEETGQEEGLNDKLTHGFTSLQSSSIGAPTKKGDEV